MKDQTACKPGSVPPLRSKLRRDAAAIPLDRPSLDGSRDLPGYLRPTTALPVARRDIPIRSCSWRGLPCRFHCWKRGALLPHPFTLTLRRTGRRFAFCGAVPGVAPGGRYPPPCRRGARTFLPRRKARATARPSDPRGKWSPRACGSTDDRQGGSSGRQAPARNTAMIRARVSPSATPSTFDGRQCLWKARTTVAVWASNLPLGAES